MIEKILEQPSIFEIEDIIVNKSKDITFVSVVVNMIVNDKEEIMIGSALIKNELNEAIVKATLDAVNRRVQRNIS